MYEHLHMHNHILPVLALSPIRTGRSPTFLQPLTIFVRQLVFSVRKMVYWRLSVVINLLLVHFAASLHFCSIKILLPTKLVDRGFCCSLIVCQQFRNLSRTDRGPIVNIVASNIMQDLYSSMEKAAFPGQGNYSQISAIALCNFREL